MTRQTDNAANAAMALGFLMLNEPERSGQMLASLNEPALYKMAKCMEELTGRVSAMRLNRDRGDVPPRLSLVDWALQQAGEAEALVSALRTETENMISTEES